MPHPSSRPVIRGDPNKESALRIYHFYTERPGRKIERETSGRREAMD